MFASYPVLARKMAVFDRPAIRSGSFRHPNAAVGKFESDWSVGYDATDGARTNNDGAENLLTSLKRESVAGIRLSRNNLRRRRNSRLQKGAAYLPPEPEISHVLELDRRCRFKIATY